MSAPFSIRLPAVGLVLAAAWIGCASEPEETTTVVSTAAAADADAHAQREYTKRVPKSYANLESLYTGDFGIYRGCGPNNGVCHNSREFPNLATIGSLVEAIGLPCNQKRDDPAQIHDLCE